jgi:biopolymer transport protein ExbB/TolQ
METFNSVIRFLQSGGVFMYPIVLVLAIGVAIAIERYIYLSLVRASNRRAWKRVLPLLESGKYEHAREFAIRSRAAMSRILGYGLNRARTSDSGEDVQMAMEEGLLEIVPRLEKRTHYLATFANIATLLGLLGTIMGLIEAFTAVSGADPADKANLLSWPDGRHSAAARPCRHADQDGGAGRHPGDGDGEDDQPDHRQDGHGQLRP